MRQCCCYDFAFGIGREQERLRIAGCAVHVFLIHDACWKMMLAFYLFNRSFNELVSVCVFFEQCLAVCSAAFFSSNPEQSYINSENREIFE